MAIFNQQSASKRDIPAPVEASKPIETALKREPDPNEFSPVASVARAVPVERSEGKESLIASDLTIEGKIEGAGHIRIAGRFKGDVHVQGDLTIEVGAKLNGGGWTAEKQQPPRDMGNHRRRKRTAAQGRRRGVIELRCRLHSSRPK